MQKVKLTADVLLGILQSVLSDNDIDMVNDPEAPEEWQGKSIQELLNIEYFTFKHRPESSEQIVRQKHAEGVLVDELLAVNRAFGCFTLSSVERDFSKNTDTAVCSGVLDFWVQTSKIKLLEYLLERCNVALASTLIPVQFKMADGTVEHRTMTIVFSQPDTPDIDVESAIGESVQIPVGIDIGLSLPTTQMIDYKFEFSTAVDNGAPTDFVEVPISDYSFTSSATSKGIPLMEKPRETGVVNLSNGKSFALTFDGVADNAFVEWLVAQSLLSNSSDNNQPIYLRITRCGASITYITVITQHTVKVVNDGSSEAHSLNLSVRGVQ